MAPKPFKPPRPSISSAKKPSKSKQAASASSGVRKGTSTGTGKSISRASGSSTFSLPALDSSDSEADPFATADGRTEDAEEEEEEADVTVIPDDDGDRAETIPPELLSRLLQEFFKKDGTRMHKDASRAAGKYMETFVREALARAAFMRADIQAQSGGGGAGDGFLEVC